jgi:hypothetical protein
MSLGIDVAVAWVIVVGGGGDGVVTTVVSGVVEGEPLLQDIKRLVNKMAVLPIIFFIVIANFRFLMAYL